MRTFLILLILSLAALTIDGAASRYPSRIVGGSDAPEGKYPYQVSLWVNRRRFLCGGSIINERYILTAAHCIDNRRPEELTIVAGSQVLSEPGTTYTVDKLIPHKWFSMATIKNDIGLIKLSEKIVYSEKIQPIALPTEDFTGDEDILLLSGWGRLSAGGRIPNILQEIELKVLNQRKCLYWFAVYKSQLCTLTKKGEGACNGDSGGPLVADGTQVGIVSYGRPCAVGYPDVFTRVYYYIDWIEANIDEED